MFNKGTLLTALISTVLCFSPSRLFAQSVGVTYQTHVQNIGWQNWVSDGATAGTTGQSLRVEAININLTNPLPGMHIVYQTHVQNIGWQAAVQDGATAGTTGQSLRVEAIRILLSGSVPAGYHVKYRVHQENIGWGNWVVDSQQAGVTGQSLRLEALEIGVYKDGGGSGVTYSGFASYNFYDGVPATSTYCNLSPTAYGMMVTAFRTDLAQAYESSRGVSACGKQVRVTNTANGASVTLTIIDHSNDYSNNGGQRYLDLSAQAFDVIGNRDSGFIPVTFTILD